MPNILDMMEQAAQTAYPTKTAVAAAASTERLASAEQIAAERARVASEGQLWSMLRSLNAELARYNATGDRQVLENWKQKEQAINTLIGFQTRLETQRMGNVESWNEAKLRAVAGAASVAAKNAANAERDQYYARRTVDSAVAQANREFAADVRSPERDQKVLQRAGSILGQNLAGAYGDPNHFAWEIIQEEKRRGIQVAAAPEEQAAAQAAATQRQQKGANEAAQYTALANAAIAATSAPAGSPMYGRLQADIDALKPLQEAAPVSDETLADIAELEAQREVVKERLGLDGEPQQEAGAGFTQTDYTQADEERFIAWSKARGYDIGFWSEDGTWVPGRDLGNAQLAFQRQKEGERTPFLRGKPSGETELVQYQMPDDQRSFFSTDADVTTVYERRPDGSVLAHKADGSSRIVRTADGLYPAADLRAAYEAAKEGETPLDTPDGRPAVALDVFDGNLSEKERTPTFGEFHGVRQPPLAYDSVNTRRYRNADGTEVIFHLNEKGQWVPERTPPLPATFDGLGENKMQRPSLGDRFRELRGKDRLGRERLPEAKPPPDAPPAAPPTGKPQLGHEKLQETAPPPTIESVMSRQTPMGPPPQATVQPVPAIATPESKHRPPPAAPPASSGERFRGLRGKVRSGRERLPEAKPPPDAPPAAPLLRPLQQAGDAAAKAKMAKQMAAPPVTTPEDIDLSGARVIPNERISKMEEDYTPPKGRARGPVTGPPSRQELENPEAETAPPDTAGARLLAALLKKRMVK